MSSGHSTEPTFNEALGSALRRAKVPWRRDGVIRIENTRVIAGKPALQPDILISEPGTMPVVVESSFLPRDADQDAISRLGEKTADQRLPIRTAVALAIDGEYRDLNREESHQSIIGGARLQYALYQIAKNGHSRWPNEGFLSGTVFNLAQLIVAAIPKTDIDSTGDEVADLIEQAATLLEQNLTKAQQNRIARRVHQRTALKGMRTTMVLWLNALLVQQRLSEQKATPPQIPGVPFAHEHTPKPSKIVAVWRAILRENWRAIFEPAVAVLENAAQIKPKATQDALARLIEAAEIIECARLGLHINIGAELFPRLSDDRKRIAAFYTQPTTAELLAGLTLRVDDIPQEEWKRSELMKTRVIGDLACGTGTLLRAGYLRLGALHERIGDATSDSLMTLHANAMEYGLVGTDISPIAAHLTSSSLVSIGQGGPFGATRIGWVQVGRSRGGHAQTGSLEYFANRSLDDLFDVVAGSARGVSAQRHEKHSVVVPDQSIDWILMNPPYSRTRGGQKAFDITGLSDEERKACQRRWGWLVKNEPVNNKAGMAPSFLALADHKIKRGGRIGFVLPLTAAFAQVWEPTRQMIQERYKKITAVVVAAGQALGDDALSADTQMEEMLLVATRRTNEEMSHPPSPIHCVTLKHPPMRTGQAGEIARLINHEVEGTEEILDSRPIRAGGEEIGHLTLFPRQVRGMPWWVLGVMHPDVAPTAYRLVNGTLGHLCENMPLGVPMIAIEDLFTVGPTHHLIGHPQGKDPIGAFEMIPVAEPRDAIGPDRSLWAAKSKIQRYLAVRATHRGRAHPNSTHNDRQAMRAHQSTLFYSRNMRLTSQRLLVAVTELPCLGGRAWTTLRHDDANICKAFALWANSTFGMVVHWTTGQRTQTGRSTAQVKALSKIRCPNFSQLSEEILRRAGVKFDALAKLELLPACQAHADGNRHRLDHAVIEMFGLGDEGLRAIETLRDLWCSEPSVHGGNRAALESLRERDLV